MFPWKVDVHKPGYTGIILSSVHPSICPLTWRFFIRVSGSRNFFQTSTIHHVHISNQSDAIVKSVSHLHNFAIKQSNLFKFSMSINKKGIWWNVINIAQLSNQLSICSVTLANIKDCLYWWIRILDSYYFKTTIIPSLHPVHQIQ